MDTKFKHFQLTNEQQDECRPVNSPVGEQEQRLHHQPRPTSTRRQRNPWSRGPFPNRKGNLIAYIRYTDDPWDAGRQLERLQEYCSRHDFKMEKAFEDQGKPGMGLARALEALEYADGLIAVDLDRFVQHEGDKTRDLRPLIHEFLSIGSKRLITIAEGIDTGSIGGQNAAIEMINQPRNHGLDLA